jgi:hypothetical protein
MMEVLDEHLHIMNYYDGSIISLGDIVTVPVPNGVARGRVVMLGDTYEHLDIDQQILEWVKRDSVLEASSIVIQWVENNPFTHNDKQYAPVGDMMFTPVDQYVKRVE